MEEVKRSSRASGHGPLHDIDHQAMAKLTALDQAVAVVSGTVAPFDESLVLGWRRMMTTNVVIGEAHQQCQALTRQCS